MIIKNTSKNTILSNDAKIASTFLDRTLGLLNKNNPKTLVFFTRFGLHTFGLNKPIDILVLKGDCTVKKLGKNISPNGFFFYNPVFNIVIELPKGTIDSTQTCENDKIKFA